MKDSMIISAGTLAFILGCILCLTVHSKGIEGDLTARSASALQAANVIGAEPSFSGRDATLAGSVGSDVLKAQAEAAVSGVYGVRTVHNQLQVAAPPPPGPVPTAARLQQLLDDALRGRTIEFASGSSEMTEAAIAILDRLVPLLKGYPDETVEIGGHTDSQGRPAANLDLSNRRARSVKQYLASRGVRENRLSSAGFGDARPVADNATVEGRIQNRRIEFRVEDE